VAGQFSQALSLFANALVEEHAGVDGVHRALQELARCGASSGLDAAAGVLAAVSAALHACSADEPPHPRPLPRGERGFPAQRGSGHPPGRSVADSGFPA
jgi:hypothetical protein